MFGERCAKYHFPLNPYVQIDISTKNIIKLNAQYTAERPHHVASRAEAENADVNPHIRFKTNISSGAIAVCILLRKLQPSIHLKLISPCHYLRLRLLKFFIAVKSHLSEIYIVTRAFFFPSSDIELRPRRSCFVPLRSSSPRRNR